VSRISSQLYIGFAVILMACGWLAAQNGTVSPAAGDVRIKSGFKLMLDLDTPLNSNTVRIDDIVWFTARHDVKIDGRVAMFRGTPIRGSVVSVKPAIVNGKNQRSEIQIRLEEIPLAEGGSLAIAAQTLRVQGEKAGQSVTQTAVGQASQGAMLGGMIGRSAKGAGIGAVAAIGIGVVGAVLQGSGPSSDVDLPVGSIFEAKLERPLTIPAPTMLAKAVPKPPVPATSDSPPLSAGAPAVLVTIPDQGISESKEKPEGNVPAFESLAANEIPPAPAAPASSTAAVDVPKTETPPTEGLATLKVDVNLVQVDTIVRDRTGKPMSSLRQEDFRVFEDGAEQRIQFFSRDQQPLAVALVIDRSGSVAPLMSNVQTAAYQSLQLLKAGDEVCLFAFAGNVELLEELTPNRQRVANRIGGIRAGGGTAIVDAVSEALRYLEAAAPDKRRAVILISDNAEGRSAMPVDYAVELALETEAVVYSVKVGNTASAGSVLGIPGIPGLPLPRLPLPRIGGVGGDPVPTITKETGGEIFDATGGSSIGAALTTAVDRLKLRYTLSYTPPNAGVPGSAKGAYHRIEVRLVSRFGRPDTDYTVHARSGYYDPTAKKTTAVPRQ